MAVFLGILLVVFFIFFAYCFTYLLIWLQNVREYRLAKNKEQYLFKLEAKHKRCRVGRKKNFLLYLSILALRDLGKEEEAKKLIPFLKSDRLLGIKK